jgi:hypothetical protein
VRLHYPRVPDTTQRCPTRKGQHVANYHRYLSPAPACSYWIAEGRPRQHQSLSNRTAHGALSIGCALGEIETSRLTPNRWDRRARRSPNEPHALGALWNLQHRRDGTVCRSDGTERNLPAYWDIDPARVMRPRFADRHHYDDDYTKENRRPVICTKPAKERRIDEGASDIAQGATALNDNDLLTLTMSLARIAPDEMPSARPVLRDGGPWRGNHHDLDAFDASAGALRRSLGNVVYFGSAGLRSPQITSSPCSIQARPSVAPTDPAPMIAIPQRQ